MSSVGLDKESLRRRAIELIAADGHRVGTRLASACGLSRQVANGYLQAMVRDGLIDAEGTTRARIYRLKALADVQQRFPREGLDEDRVWRELITPQLSGLSRVVRDVWQYGSTEMINNAIDHSASAEVNIGVVRNALDTEITVSDEGEGIFLKLQRALGLHDSRESIFELAKGKLTTAPEHHSGEGIFFTSRVMDAFEIVSHHLRFSHQPRAEDQIAEQTIDTPGTRVRMRLRNDSTRTMKEVFDRFTEGEDMTFDKTAVPMHLAQHEDDKLVSRSQAKRVAHGFDRFKRVELDFTGVEEIGQAFADELFRVFARAHPDIRITPVNTVPAVAGMIRRVVSAPEPGSLQ
jgi:anti-sigma regulatory factor (Ser/Thr protein kinase)